MTTAHFEPVIFGIWGTQLRVERLYDRARLKLGSPVYVHFSDQNQPIEFSPEQTIGTVPYWVRWVATSEWYVALVPRFDLRPEFAERLHKELEGYLSRDEIDRAIAKFIGMVRMDHYYQTSELGRNPLSVVFTVIDRLSVCRRLRQDSPYPDILRSTLDDPLVSYLYLTCFDRLGQPADWLDFSAWMVSSRRKGERDAILQRAPSQGLEESIRFVYREYNSLYGVRSAFVRFLRALPPEFYRQLMNSIQQDISHYPPDLTGREATDEEKEKYLFRRRNDYTHKADFRPPPGEWFGGGTTNIVQEYGATTWTSTQTHGWPDILEKAVRIGLARYISAF